MSNNGKRYDEEFKEELIRLVEEGRSIPKVADDFGISPQTLRNWIKKSRSKNDPKEESVEELKAQLRAEKRRTKELETTVKILKKATAIFMKDDQN